MTRIFIIAFSGLLLFSCKNSKPENKPFTIKEFLALYKPADLPVNIADSALAGFGDTTTIEYSLFTQFVPDSAVKKIFVHDHADGYSIHPATIIHTKTIDYLVTKFTSSKATLLAVFVIDNKHQYKTSLLLINDGTNDDYNYSVSITNEPTFIIRREKKGADNEVLYSRNGYAFNETTNSFSAVLNDSNEDAAKRNEITNPVDTLAAINKLSGDYVTDKRNFISLRDGKGLHNYIFFIHFEKNKGDCIGELKGEMNFADETNAVYQESGGPCVIHFKISANSIRIKEEGNCGNYRGITCPFDFTFKKKKQSKASNP